MMDKLVISQRVAAIVAVVLAVIILADVAYAAHKGSRRAQTRIHPCALVLTTNGHECR